MSASGAPSRKTSAARIPAGPAPTMTKRCGISEVLPVERRHCERSEAIQSTRRTVGPGLLRLRLGMTAVNSATPSAQISMQVHVLVFDRQVVDAAIGGRDPARHL